MNYATNFAIVEDGVVTNIAWGAIHNMDEFPNAVQIDDLSVNIGDAYADGVFYLNGERVRTNAEIMGEMQEALNILLGGATV